MSLFEIKRAQAEFGICYATFYSLQNRKKISKKKAAVRGETGLTPLLYIVIFPNISIEKEYC